MLHPTSASTTSSFSLRMSSLLLRGLGPAAARRQRLRLGLGALAPGAPLGLGCWASAAAAWNSLPRDLGLAAPTGLAARASAGAGELPGALSTDSLGLSAASLTGDGAKVDGHSSMDRGEQALAVPERDVSLRGTTMMPQHVSSRRGSRAARAVEPPSALRGVQRDGSPAGHPSTLHSNRNPVAAARCSNSWLLADSGRGGMAASPQLPLRSGCR